MATGDSWNYQLTIVKGQRERERERWKEQEIKKERENKLLEIILTKHKEEVSLEQAHMLHNVY